MRLAAPRSAPAWLVLGLLVVSISALRLIPYGPFWGWDLENLFAFHRCGAPAAAAGIARNDPYLLPGRVCGDSIGRPMVYPPLLYWMFVWLRWVPFAAAVRLWAAVIVVTVAALLFIWVPPGERSARRDWPVLAFWALLLPQFPLIFSAERGNVDVVPLLLWTLSFAAFRRRRAAVAGALAGFAAAAKLYPAIACAVVAIGLSASPLRRGRRPLEDASRFAVGMAAAAVAAVAAWPRQSLEYFLRVAPEFARAVPPAYVYSHSLPSLVGDRRWIATAIVIALFAIWALASVRRLHRDPGSVFAGGLAISTCFAATSYDYNLICAYPLLLLQMSAAWRHGGVARWTVLLLGVLAVAGNRAWFASPALYAPHVSLQILWLAWSGIRAAAGTTAAPA